MEIYIRLQEYTLTIHYEVFHFQYTLSGTRLFYLRALDVEKGKKSSTDLVIEKSVELYGFTPNEKSDENLKWMLENGYLIKQVQRVRA